MDLKALIAKMDQIEKKKFLVESKDKGDMDHDGVDEPDPKEYKDNKDAAIKKAMGKDKEEKDVEESILDFKGAIAQALLKEFGLDEQTPIANPYQGADAAKFAAMSPADQEWLTRGGQVPDINDQFILARAPNKGRPVTPPAGSGLKAPAGFDIAPNAGKPAAAPAADPAAADQADNYVPDEPAGAAPDVPAMPDQTDAETARLNRQGQASAPADSGAKGGINTTVLNRYKQLLDKLEKGSAPSPVKEQDNAILALIRNM